MTVPPPLPCPYPAAVPALTLFLDNLLRFHIPSSSTRRCAVDLFEEEQGSILTFTKPCAIYFFGRGL